MAWVSNRRTFLAAGMGTLVAALTGCGGGSGGPGTPSSTTTVTGIVYDSAKGDTEVEGATVTMGGVSGKTVTTDQAPSTGQKVGTFVLTNVPVGTNSLTVTFTNVRTINDAGNTETFTDTQTLRFEPAVARGTNNIGELYVNIGQVAGKVLLPNGQPTDGAFVSISSTGDLVQTDANGNFLILNVPRGNTDISAVFGTANGSKSVTVNNGVTDVGTLQLTEDTNPNPPGLPATITGKVTTSDGKAAEGATVILLRDGVQREQTIANATGEYSFFVPAGNYSIRVLLDGYLEGNASGVVTNPNTAIRLDVTVSPRT